MIRDKGILIKCEEYADFGELNDALNRLPVGEYGYLLFDKERNKLLPQLKYLFGIVHKHIYENHTDKPGVDELYKYFEEIYSPLRTCIINGEKYEYIDLKNENAKEMSDFIERVIQHAQTDFVSPIFFPVETN